MRQKIILVLVMLFAIALIYFTPLRNKDSSLKPCFEKIHDFKEIPISEIVQCFEIFKNESFENLLVVEWKKNLSPIKFEAELNKLWPLLNKSSKVKLLKVLDQLKQKERIKENLEYYTILDGWLNQVEEVNSIDVDQIMKICQGDEYQKCFDLLNEIDENFDFYNSQAYSEFILLTTAKLKKKKLFLTQYNSLSEMDKIRWKFAFDQFDEDSKVDELEKSSSQNFELFVENEIFELADEHYNVLEEALTELSSKYNWYRSVRIPVVLYSSSEYNGLDNDEAWVEALYDGRIRIPAKVLNDPIRLKKVALHELSHCMLDQRIGRTPTWFNEGVAQYLEGKFNNTKPELTLGIEELEGSFFELKNEDEIRLAYEWSLYIVAVLFEKQGESAFWNFLQEGKDLSFEENFIKNFKVSTQQFLKDIIQE